MLVKKYFIDYLYYDINDDKVYGDMVFTFCDMPETMCDTFENAKENVSLGIEEDINEYMTDDTIPIYMIVEYVFDTDKFHIYTDGSIDEDYSLYNTDAIVENNSIYAEAPCGTLFDKVNIAWRKNYDFDITNHN